MSKIEKSPVTTTRKMLLMKDRSFLYELRAYLIYVKVGERSFLIYAESLSCIFKSGRKLWRWTHAP